MVVQSHFAQVRCCAFLPFSWHFIAAFLPLLAFFVARIVHSHFLCGRIDNNQMETPLAHWVCHEARMVAGIRHESKPRLLHAGTLPNWRHLMNHERTAVTPFHYLCVSSHAGFSRRYPTSRV